MKRFLLVLFVFISTCLNVFAENLIFLKEDYELQFSQKNSPNYINEYVRPSQNLENWSNMVTVHYFPKMKSEEYLNRFIAAINASPQMYAIKSFPQYKLISFGIVAADYIEYNVLRCEEAKNGGINVIQFAHKYKFKDDKESFQQAYERSLKYNMKYINGLLNTKMPEIKKDFYQKG